MQDGHGCAGDQGGSNLQRQSKFQIRDGPGRVGYTQASFNTIRYKGRDCASGIDRKLSIIRPGATTIVAP